MKNTKNVTVLIQARTNSRRFPNKVLTKIENKPLIWHVINRVKTVKGVNQIILVTTRKQEDKILLDIAKKCGILSFTGTTNDVLNRFYKCALHYSADPIIRITGDNPLIDPKHIEKFLKFFIEHDYDYVSNTIIPTYPDGLDVEIFSFKALKKNFENATLKSEREHVTPYIINHKKKFKLYNFSNKENLSHIRLTVDEKNDLKLIRKIYSLMKPQKIFYTADILKLVSKNPKLLEINKGIIRNEGYLYSISRDKK